MALQYGIKILCCICFALKNIVYLFDISKFKISLYRKLYLYNFLSAANTQYDQGEEGKTELSLVAFSCRHPTWQPTKPSQKQFLKSLRQSINTSVTQVPLVSKKTNILKLFFLKFKLTLPWNWSWNKNYCRYRFIGGIITLTRATR